MNNLTECTEYEVVYNSVTNHATAVHITKTHGARKIGYSLRIVRRTYVALPESAASGYRHAPGTFYKAEVQKTVGGGLYNSSSTDREFLTYAEALEVGSRIKAAKLAKL